MYWLTGVMGFFMMISPYIFGYANNATALWTSIIAGLLVVGASVGEAVQKDKANWEYWLAGGVGLFAIVAPFVLGFNEAVATWTTIIVGGVIAVVAGSRLWIGGQKGAY